MLQDQFLNALTQGHVPVTVYLVNGIRLQGYVESHDQYGLMLGGSSQQFVFKHAISTIVPAQDVTAAVRSDHKEGVAADPAPTSRLRLKRPPGDSQGT
jgi:host factor-I protein